MTELAIRVDVYQPKIRNGKDTGLLEFVKQRTFGELREQFEATLAAINMPCWDCSALGAAEYISYQEYKQDEDALLPKGELVSLARRGHCEGYQVEICLRNENGYQPLISAKYLSERDSVWKVAKFIDEAIDNGLSGY